MQRLRRLASAALILFFTTRLLAQQVHVTGDRISISFDGPPSAIPSLFIADASNPPPARIALDSSHHRWTLSDDSGVAIVTGDLGQIARNIIRLRIGQRAGERFYGSGGGRGAPPSLSRRQGQGAVAGGFAMVPYYWSTAGYAVLGISENDNRPASWDARSPDAVTWEFEGSRCDLYLMPAKDLYAACRAFAQVSGFPLVPPRWTFGYLQSRWGWTDAAYIDDAEKQFVARKLPVDAFIFDFEWFTPQADYDLPPTGAAGYPDFSWNPKLFPHPAAQIARLAQDGIHTVLMRKPRLGNSDTLKTARQNRWILPNGTGVNARCLDFSNPNVVQWYKTQLTPFINAGVDGWWDDEGEITPTTYYYWNQAQAAAIAAVNPNERPWFLDRSFIPGLQRLGAAAWTADIPADWPTLAKTPGDLLNWSLAGMDYSACDIGGYYTDCTPDLLVRWMQAGIFFPVMRAHSQTGVTPRFPWLYGEPAEAAIRHALQLRYRLIPMLYSLGHLAHETGVPIMRPLVMQYPDDPNVWDLTTQWLIGPGLMAAPLLGPEDHRDVYLPKDQWFEFSSNRAVNGPRTISASANLDQVPIYVRAGTILPLAPPILHTRDLPGGPLELQIYPGKDADFTLVEDDGLTTAYLHGDTRRAIFHWNDQQQILSWQIAGPYHGKDIFIDMNTVVFNPLGIKKSRQQLTTSGAIDFSMQPAH